MLKTIPNETFLRDFLGDNPPTEKVLLPHESALVDEAYRNRMVEFDQVVQDKISVTGGDDWHDGAFRATDALANILSESAAAIMPFLRAQVVDYPSSDETRVTLGSRVTVEQKGVRFPLDIVGYRTAYPREVIDPASDEEVTATNIESPLGRAVMGHMVGETVSYLSGDKELSAKLVGLSQTAIREYFIQGEATVGEPTR